MKSISSIIKKSICCVYDYANTNGFDIDIEKIEWEAFFYVIYEETKGRYLENSYEDFISEIINHSLLKFNFKNDDRKNNYTLYNLLSSLWILNAYNFRTKEIELIQEEVKYRCDWGKILTFKKYEKEKII